MVRLSRTVFWSLGGVGMVAVAFALGYVLESSHQAPPSTEMQDVDAHSSADGLAGLPSDYLGKNVPKLGPALPGDLGHTILHAQEQGSARRQSGFQLIPWTPSLEKQIGRHV